MIDSVGDFRPKKGSIVICNLEKGDLRSAGGLIIQDDNMKDRGIRPRWAQVYRVGPEVHDDIQEGDWILLTHGHWTHIFEHQEPSGRVIGLQVVERDKVIAGALGIQKEIPGHLKVNGYVDFRDLT